MVNSCAEDITQGLTSWTDRQECLWSDIRTVPCISDPTGMISPDEHSPFFRKQNFSQIKVNSAIFHDSVFAGQFTEPHTKKNRGQKRERKQQNGIKPGRKCHSTTLFLCVSAAFQFPFKMLCFLGCFFSAFTPGLDLSVSRRLFVPAVLSLSPH